MPSFHSKSWKRRHDRYLNFSFLTSMRLQFLLSTVIFELRIPENQFRLHAWNDLQQELRLKSKLALANQSSTYELEYKFEWLNRMCKIRIVHNITMRVQNSIIQSADTKCNQNIKGIWWTWMPSKESPFQTSKHLLRKFLITATVQQSPQIPLFVAFDVPHLLANTSELVIRPPHPSVIPHGCQGTTLI